MSPASRHPRARAWLLRRLLEVLLLLTLGAALGWALNAVRRDSLPTHLPGALLLTESGAPVVFLREARQLFEEADYVFVDARPQESFLAGHIEGALSLPPERFTALYPELQLWSGGQPLLVYAGRGNVLPADQLAIRLGEVGESAVVLLGVGYEGWVADGLPIATGAEGLLTGGEEAR